MPFATELVGSTVELLVLKLLAERAMYGYEIMQIVHERTAGAFNWKEGTLYPVLHRLEKQEFLLTEWQRSDTGQQRKYYTLSPQGMAYAQGKAAEWQAFEKSVNAVLCAPAD